MHTDQPQKPFALVFVPLALLLVVVAFLLGAFFGLVRERDNATMATDDTTEEATSTSKTPDVDDDEGIAVDWTGEERGGDHPFNYYLRQWWEAEPGSGAFDDSEMHPYAYSATIIDTIDGGGLYDGYYLVDNVVTKRYEIGETRTHFYLLEKPNEDYRAVVLTRYGYSETWGFDEAWIAEVDAEGLATSAMQLAGFVEPQTTLTSTDGAMTFTLLGSDMTYTALPPYDHTVATTSGTTLYESTESYAGEFFFLQPDGRAVWYDMDVPFWQDDDGANAATPSIVWDDGAEVGMYMKGRIGGCGFVNPTNVVDEEDLPELAATGRAQGDASIIVYEPADYAAVAESNAYADWARYVRTSNGDDADTSIAAFAAEHPTFYYEDPLGRWLMFTTTKAAPAAECGKPVIYLYPESTTRVDVLLTPRGGFTKSEPAYNGGWHVVAEPDGTLTNLADGQTYPYLFWEGRGGWYAEPVKYWVVAREDVHDFLVATLARLGLNAQETADFMEFWEPRMQAAPYYKVGFHGTSVMDVLAPMTLSVAPDTVLRILMDYTELASPIPSNPPALPPTPTREGFTVIEWGGVIR